MSHLRTLLPKTFWMTYEQVGEWRGFWMLSEMRKTYINSKLLRSTWSLKTLFTQKTVLLILMSPKMLYLGYTDLYQLQLFTRSYVEEGNICALRENVIQTNPGAN